MKYGVNDTGISRELVQVLWKPLSMLRAYISDQEVDNFRTKQ